MTVMALLTLMAACVSHFSAARARYLYAIYFTLATVTSVGYGDINAAAFNAPEQMVNTFIMLVGALMFAYLIVRHQPLENTRPCSLAPTRAPSRSPPCPSPKPNGQPDR